MTTIAVQLPLTLPPDTRVENWWRKYRRYLKSAEWQVKRALAMLSANGVCEMRGCGKPATEVHHKTYARLGHEWLDDLMAVCRACHERISEKPVTRQ